MLEVKRGDLLESKVAIDALGKVYMPVSKDQYWFIKTLAKVLTKFKQQNVAAQEHSNEVIKQVGTKQPDGRNGIAPADEANMAKYREAMEAFMEEKVQIDIKPLTLEQLASAQVSMTANDQVQLQWLITEATPALKSVK